MCVCAHVRVHAGSSYSLEDEHDYESDISSRASSVSRKDPNTLAVKPAWVRERERE